MPPLGRYGQSIAELMMHQGDVRARGALRSADIWGGFAQNMGNLASQTLVGYSQEKDVQRREQMLNETIANWNTEDPMANYRALAPVLGSAGALKMVTGMGAVQKMQNDLAAQGQVDPGDAKKTIDALAGAENRVPGYIERNWGDIYPLLQKPAEALGQPLSPQWSPDITEGIMGISQGLPKPQEPGSFGAYAESTDAPLLDDRAAWEAAGRAPQRPSFQDVTIGGQATMATPEEIAAAKSAGTPVTPYQAPPRIDPLAQELATLRVDEARAKAAKRGDAQIWGSATTDAERKRISSTRYGLEKLPGLQKFLDENKNVIGPIQGRLTKARQKTGIGASEEVGKKEAELAVLRNAIVNALSGVAVNPQEFERIKEQIPNIIDAEPVFAAKISVLQDYFKGVLQEFGAPETIGMSDGGSGNGKTLHFDSQGNLIPQAGR